MSLAVSYGRWFSGASGEIQVWPFEAAGGGLYRRLRVGLIAALDRLYGFSLFQSAE